MQNPPSQAYNSDFERMMNARRSDDSAGETFPSTALRILIFSSAALSLLFATLTVGSQPWAILCLLALVIQAMADQRISAMACIVPALSWLILFRVTGNRELFFPYAMYLAAHVSLLLCRRSYWLGTLGGTLIVAAFLAVRFQQHAPARVLAVEFGVATGILSLAIGAYAVCPKNGYTCVIIAATASVGAYFGLSL